MEYEIKSKRKKANVRCGKGWLRISALGGREKNIRLDFIKQVEFEKNEILIQIDGEEWTTIRAYNHQTIERYVEDKNKGYRDLFNEKGEDKYITEATNLQREWIEALGQNIPLPKGKKIYIWIEPGTDAYYLKDEDFNKLSDRLNRLIDDYAIEEEREEEKMSDIGWWRTEGFFEASGSLIRDGDIDRTLKEVRHLLTISGLKMIKVNRIEEEIEYVPIQSRRLRRT